jgi:hypothetical protein
MAGVDYRVFRTTQKQDGKVQSLSGKKADEEIKYESVPICIFNIKRIIQHEFVPLKYVVNHASHV